MIMTREEYDSWVVNLGQQPEMPHEVQLIEMLRDRIKFAIRRYDLDGDALQELLGDLPSWITEDGE